jgi:hypothetical protein
VESTQSSDLLWLFAFLNYFHGISLVIAAPVDKDDFGVVANAELAEHAEGTQTHGLLSHHDQKL